MGTHFVLHIAGRILHRGNQGNCLCAKLGRCHDIIEYRNINLERFRYRMDLVLIEISIHRDISIKYRDVFAS